MESLIVFVKNPVKGKVKTRIAADSGDEQALVIYKSLLQHTAKVISELKYEINIFYDSWINEDDEYFSNPFIKKHIQEGTDLGFRMHNAFDKILAQSTKAIIIGSDCLQLSSSIIKDAFECLDSNDVVLGPSADGGYYLLGLKANSIDFFEGIDWSTEKVLEQTLIKINSAKLKHHLLIELKDIDHLSDWEAQKHLLDL